MIDGDAMDAIEVARHKGKLETVELIEQTKLRRLDEELRDEFLSQKLITGGRIRKVDAATEREKHLAKTLAN